MCRCAPVGLPFRYGRRIADASTRLYLKCTNCGVVFPSKVSMEPVDFARAEIEEKTYKCPVCANFDRYGKQELFYDNTG